MASSTRKPGLSIKDVARVAGVSAQTVSRVANGSSSVRPETRERVEAAMSQLGYVPNHAARALRVGRFSTIGLMAHRFERTGEAMTLKAVVEAAEENDLSVTLIDVPSSTSAGWNQRASRLAQQAIDALVVIRAETAVPELLALPPSLPIAASDSRLAGHLPGVVVDQIQGSVDAVGHLLELGHRTVHHISGPLDSVPGRVRQGAWRRTLEEAGIHAPNPLVGDWTAESGYRAGLQLLNDPSVTAVFCANDETAFGLMRALHEGGRRVPQDISVIGFDDIGLAPYAQVPLTTIRQDFHQIGHELVRLVLAQMAGTPRAELGRVVLPSELIVRGSTAVPRPRSS